MKLRQFLCLFLIIFLSSCSSQSPVPTDHYYRLPELSDINPGNQLLNTISVMTFQADGLYQERAIIYSEEETELKQYHYHHWVESPPRLLQERLVERLRLSKLSKLVLNSYEGDSDLVIKGQIKSFERIHQENHESTTVKLILQVNYNNERLPILHKEYSQSVILSSGSMTHSIKAFAEAIDLIFSDFYIDLVEILKV